MTKASYAYFLRNYAANKPLEDISIQKALEHFNRESPTKPFRVAATQKKANYKTMLHDATLINGERCIRVEAKTDDKSRTTGNFFIEFDQYGKASGIKTTDADYYVITDTIKFYLISVYDINEELAALDNEGLLKIRYNINGEKMKTKGYVVEKSRLLKFAVDIT